MSSTLITYNSKKKILAPSYAGEKISNSRGFGKKFLPNYITHTPPQVSWSTPEGEEKDLTP